MTGPYDHVPEEHQEIRRDPANLNLYQLVGVLDDDVVVRRYILPRGELSEETYVFMRERWETFQPWTPPPATPTIKPMKPFGVQPPAAFHRRLARDLRANDRVVISQVGMFELDQDPTPIPRAGDRNNLQLHYGGRAGVIIHADAIVDVLVAPPPAPAPATTDAELIDRLTAVAVGQIDHDLISRPHVAHEVARIVIQATRAELEQHVRWQALEKEASKVKASLDGLPRFVTIAQPYGGRTRTADGYFDGPDPMLYECVRVEDVEVLLGLRDNLGETPGGRG